MKIPKKNIPFFIIIACLLVVGIIDYRYHYNDIYLLSLNGRIKNIRKDIKEDMSITVSNKEHNISHYWPKLQKDMEIGDSVYKKSKEYDIILIKKVTKERIVCKYKE